MTNAPTFVCPLCPLACDDLSVGPNGSLVIDDCTIVDRFRIDANRGQFDEARFRGNKCPLRVITTGVDLVTARELVSLERLGQIKLTIETDPSIEAMLQTISRDGIVSATLAEVATRGDAVWLLGEVESTWPRLPIVARLNRFSGKAIQRLPQMSAEQLAERFSASAMPWGESNYAVVVIGPEAFAPGEELISAAFLARMVRQRNESSRCVCITLDDAATLRSVSLWRQNQTPESDRVGPFDIRIGTPMNGQSAPATLQIGGQDFGENHAESYLATSIAGIHHRSMVIRGDGSVSLPLSAAVPSRLPTVADALKQIIGLESAVV